MVGINKSELNQNFGGTGLVTLTHSHARSIICQSDNPVFSMWPWWSQPARALLNQTMWPMPRRWFVFFLWLRANLCVHHHKCRITHVVNDHCHTAALKQSECDFRVFEGFWVFIFKNINLALCPHMQLDRATKVRTMYTLYTWHVKPMWSVMKGKYELHCKSSVMYCPVEWTACNKDFLSSKLHERV